MRRVAIGCALLALAGCATPPKRPIEVADDAFTQGDTTGAESAYANVEKRAATPDELFRARFFGLLTRRAVHGAPEFDATLQGLRKLAADAAGSRWGKLAALYADEMSQTDALRIALQRAGADLERLQAQLTSVQNELNQSKQNNTELSDRLEENENERVQLQHAVHDLEQQLADRTAALSGLTEELEALKQIDLSRVP